MGASSQLGPAPLTRIAGTDEHVWAAVTASGGIARLEVAGLSLIQHPATAMEAGLANLHLRRHEPDGVRHTPLFGPTGRGTWTAAGDTLAVRGEWDGIAYAACLVLGPGPVWTWRANVRNAGDADAVVDVVVTQDPALTPWEALRRNEYFVSQYLDVTPIEMLPGQRAALAVRQNMPGEQAPWLILTGLGETISWCTDAAQLVDRDDPARRPGLARPRLARTRLQHEHTLLGLQSDVRRLAPGESTATGFVGMFVPDHPGASGPSDRAYAERAIRAVSGWQETELPGPNQPCTATLFSESAALRAGDLDEATLNALLADEARDTERAPDGTIWALTGTGTQVVTRAKEAAVLRPHGAILRSGDALTPDTGSLTSTAWMGGGFHSQLTRGEASRCPVLTLRRTYLEVLAAHGLRIFVRPGPDAAWQLLDRPSAWRVAADSCTWAYAAAGVRVDVTAGCRAAPHEAWLELTVRDGPDQEVLLALAVDPGEDGVDVISDDAVLTLRQRDPSGALWRFDTGEHGGPGGTVGGDAPLWSDGRDRGSPWLTVTYPATRTVGLRISAAALHPEEQVEPPARERIGPRFADWLAGAVTLSPTPDPSGAAGQAWTALAASVPWLAHDALVHYLSPRGLEQYTGGAWGTRDACQGPVGLLTALDRPEAIRDLLLRVFRDQNARGDWPQAFDFLPPLRAHGQVDSHGDVVHWPLVAAGDYLRATGDASLLAERVPLVGDAGPTHPVSVAEHLRRAVAAVEDGTVRGGSWPAYGHGDWNDALQPADPSLARRMVSTWTAVLQIQGLRTLGAGLRTVAAEPELAARAARLAERTAAALSQLGAEHPVLPGYLIVEDGVIRETLVRPGDVRTGLDYGILPWIHAIAEDLVTPEQAHRHLALIDEHLTGPDGARLFDRPVHYSGGPMSTFQRAEASTFWGREIGLMYVHAHLRWAEALARVGDGPGLLRALALGTSLGASRLVAPARPRQTSTYASSSDGAFADRADADARYADLLAGRVPLEGGWRVYSSGPGLLLRLVIERLLGIRRRAERLEIDPVLDPALGEVRARLPVAGHAVEFVFRPGELGHGVAAVRVGGQDVALEPLANPYRPAGVSAGLAALHAAGESARESVTILTR